jgi:hypothetical protein
VLAWFLGSALGLLGFVYLFVVVLDPWAILPLSPPLPRVPVSSNARFTMPALARSAAFDSAVVGSSSSRLLRPVELDTLFGGHFANLAMNAATAWEQSQMLALFTRTHPAARTLIIGLDNVWCTETPERTTGRPFPQWMYQGSPFRGYLQMLTLYAVQESGSELWTMLGLKRPRYGLDGYTSFVPPESAYDPARVDAAFARWEKPSDILASKAPHVIPTLPMLADALIALPASTRKIVFFTPSYITSQGVPGSDYAAMLDACKAQVTQIARGVPNATVVDFQIPSAITMQRSSYWDPVHYRLPIASRLMADLAGAVQGHASADDRLLVPVVANGPTD